MNYKDSLTGEYIYKDNQFVLQKYTDNYYKLIRFKKLIRSSGYELPYDKIKRLKGSVNSEKLENNIRRAKNKIFEYAMCNDWDFFCTFTIDGKKYSRNDLNAFYKKFGQWLRNFQKKNGKVTYLFVPELHADGQNWHFHGLIKFDNGNILKAFQFENKAKYSLKTRLKLKELFEQGFLNWEQYEKKFGFCSFGGIKDKEKVSNYIKKYITKNISSGQKKIDKNCKLYYCSHGLKTAELIKKDDIPENISSIPADFENEYVSINILNKEQTINLFLL